MERLREPAAVSPAQSDDAFDAGIGPIGFAVHRETTPRWQVMNLANPAYDILAFAVAGRAHYDCGGQRFTAQRGCMIYFAPGVVHSARSDAEDPWTFYSVAFRLMPMGEAAAAAFSRLPVRAFPGAEPELEALFAELERAWASQEGGYRMRCRSIVLQLLQRYVMAAARPARNSPHAQRILRVVEQLQADSARDWELSHLVRLAGLSESRFRVVFRQVTGMSPVRYLNWLRLNRARALLLSGDYTVTEAAAQVGFSDVFYFSRLFKKMTGTNPSTYRVG